MSQTSGLQLRQGLYLLTNLKNPSVIPGFHDQARYLDEKSAKDSLRMLTVAFELILKCQYPSLSFEEMYRNVYYLVLHKYGRELYRNTQDVIIKHVELNVLPEILAGSYETILQAINCTWSNHHSSMSLISDTLMYLDRKYIKQTGLDNIYLLGVEVFKNVIIYDMQIQEKLQKTLLQLVMLDRCGEKIDRVLFQSVTKMLVTVNNNSPEVYQEIFEEDFLTESAELFKEKSLETLREKNVPSYLRSVNHIIASEVERSEQCFDKTTTPKIVKVAVDELIETHMMTIFEMENSGVIDMVENQRTEDLTCLYSLVSRVNGGQERLFDCISRYIRQIGCVMNQQVGAISNSSNAVAYFQSLLDLREKFQFYLDSSFSDDKNFKKVIATDFEFIINDNRKSPELLSLFVDDKLKKSARGLSEDDKTIFLENVIVLFRYLQDKDLFQQYYKQNLAKRLLTGKGINEESERAVIEKFKNECGHCYTRKMEGMFRDISDSCRITEDFRKHVNDTEDSSQCSDLSVRVLSKSYWPTQAEPPPCIMPSAAVYAFEFFQKFYLQKHCGRKLTLLPQLGSAELETYFVQNLDDGERWHSAQTQPCGETRSYTLQVSTYQMIILMLFNDQPHWSFQELQAETAIPPRDLQKALLALTTGKPYQKVLIKYPDSLNIDMNDYFCVNMGFTSKSNKVKILPAPVRFETDFERQATTKRVNNNRHWEVDAAAVRIMKSNRVMNLESLVKQVIESLRERFIPQKDFVKTRIEALIDREYISRQPNDRRILQYIPS